MRAPGCAQNNTDDACTANCLRADVLLANETATLDSYNIQREAFISEVDIFDHWIQHLTPRRGPRRGVTQIHPDRVRWW